MLNFCLCAVEEMAHESIAVHSMEYGLVNEHQIPRMLQLMEDFVSQRVDL